MYGLEVREIKIPNEIDIRSMNKHGLEMLKNKNGWQILGFTLCIQLLPTLQYIKHQQSPKMIWFNWLVAYKQI